MHSETIVADMSEQLLVQLRQWHILLCVNLDVLVTVERASSVREHWFFIHNRRQQSTVISVCFTQ